MARLSYGNVFKAKEGIAARSDVQVGNIEVKALRQESGETSEKERVCRVVSKENTFECLMA